MNVTHAHGFETLFDHPPHVITGAPGIAKRGDGLYAALPVSTHVLVARRRDPLVHAATANVEGPARLVYVLGEETKWDAWVDRVQGVTLALREAEHDIKGFDVLVRSDIPVGEGLGAGTALVVALLRALRDAYALGFDDDELSRLAYRAEAMFDPNASRDAAIAVTFADDAHLVSIDGEAHHLVPAS